MASNGGVLHQQQDSENIRVFLRIRPLVDREEGGDAQSPRRRASHRGTAGYGGRVLAVLEGAEEEAGDSQEGLAEGRSSRGSVAGRRMQGSTALARTTVLFDPSRGLAAGGCDAPSAAFVFDGVADEAVSQEDVFEAVAKPITDNCLWGYNGTIFAYGQTGSGKTYTMQGPVNGDGSIRFEARGLIPRTFDYLFERIAERASSGAVAYFCRCSYVEIYNECIYDLLDDSFNGSAVCTLREDVKKGVYVEGCNEVVIQSGPDAFALFEGGSRNRHIAETAMNRESSRSHCVFTIFIQARRVEGDLVEVQEARFNLVDLAGSERQQWTATSGARLKEAGNINKSLLALSNVINALVDAANGRARHVHYRDSRLTFLLKDSLGGNAKTSIIAAVSPSPMSQGETLSTLRFAQRAKLIKNKAVVNKDIQGSVSDLQSEVRRLKREVLRLRASAATDGSGGGEAVHSPPRGAAGSDEGAYFMLRMALERQQELLEQVASGRQQLKAAEEMIRRQEQQLSSQRMIAKLRDGTIKALNERLEGDVAALFEGERQKLQAEVAELRRLIDHHPEVTRFAFDNLQLRERLAELSSHGPAEAHAAAIAQHLQYEEALCARIVAVEQANDDLMAAARGADLGGEAVDGALRRSRRSRHLTMEGEDIPVQRVCASGDEPCHLGGEGGGASSGRQKDKGAHSTSPSGRRRRMGRASPPSAQAGEAPSIDEVLRDKKALEAKYNGLLAEQELLYRQLDGLKVASSSHASSFDSVEDGVMTDGGEGGDGGGGGKESTGKQQRKRRVIVSGGQEAPLQGGGALCGGERAREGEVAIAERQRIAALEEENVHLRSAVQDATLQARWEGRTAVELGEELAEVRRWHDGLLATLSGQLEEAQRRGDQSAEELRELSSRHDRAREAYEATCATLEAAQHDLSSRIGRITQLEGAMAGLTERLAQFDSVFGGEPLESVSRRMHANEERAEALNKQVIKLQFMIEGAHQANDHLSRQLASLEEERAAAEEARLMLTSLHAEMDRCNDEMLALRRENDKLVKHGNVKQKLQYHMQIKEENNAFRDEIRGLREELCRIGKRNIELEELLGHVVTTTSGASAGGSRRSSHAGGGAR